MERRNAIVILVVVILVSLGLTAVLGKNGENIKSPEKGEILSLSADKPNLVVEAKGLSSVEIWKVPTGTEVSNQDMLWGKATLASGDSINQTWIFQVPSEPELIGEVYAKGFNANGLLIDTEKLRERGASEINDALWDKESVTDIEMSEEATMRVGEVRSFGPLTIKILRISEDSRCPMDVQCIQAGRAAVEIELRKGNSTKTITMRSDENRVEAFEDFTVELIQVKPDPISTAQVTPSDYRVTLRIRD